VLLRHDAYRQLTGAGPNILELLAQTQGEDIEFEPVRLAGGVFTPAGFGA
jgi:hypothetical protein